VRRRTPDRVSVVALPCQTLRRPRGRVWRALLIAAVLGLGLWQIGEGLWIPAKAWLAQLLIARAWDEAMATGRPAPPWPWADTTPVARLVVPALGVDQIVLAHATGRTLAFGPGHLDGSPAPGHAGLSVVSGHRDTSFRFLAEVTPGTALRVQRADGAWIDYFVREVSVVDERTTQLPLIANGPPQLALTTCYPFDAVMPGGPLRLVALAEATTAP
jgi:sortase A